MEYNNTKEMKVQKKSASLGDTPNTPLCSISQPHNKISATSSRVMQLEG